MRTPAEVEKWVYASYMAARPYIAETRDAQVRRPQLTRVLLDRLGSPDRSAYNVIITGSKGKGSTAAIMARIMQAHGWKVGLFTGPHLLRFTERIRLNGEEIPAEAFVRLGRQVEAAARDLESCLERDEYLGPVGLTAAIAALYFQEQGTHINIWECGRGALYDDVNTLVHQAALITPIMEEHLKHLGPHLKDIVRHKLGAVTPAVHDVCIGRQDRQIMKEIGASARTWEGPSVTLMGRDVHVPHVHSSLAGTSFSVQTRDTCYKSLHLPLFGAFQADNAALAIAAAERAARRLLEAGTKAGNEGRLDHLTVRKALRHVAWPGRLELLSRQPAVLVDGAIHRRSAAYVADFLSQLNAASRPAGILIIGIPEDKDYAGVLRTLAPLARKVIVTAADRDDLTFPADAPRIAKTFCPRVELQENAMDALRSGLSDLRRREWLAIVGTQSLVGEVKRDFNHLTKECLP